MLKLMVTGIQIRSSLSNSSTMVHDAKTNNDNDKVKDQSQSKSQEDVKKRTQEVQKKWHDSCLNLHPKFHQQHVSTKRITPTPFSMTGLYNVSLMGRQFQPKIPLNKNLGTSLTCPHKLTKLLL